MQSNKELSERAKELKKLFQESKECFLHGDLHTGSVMVTNGDTKVIDAEFAMFGPMGFDIGLLVGNLFLAYFSQDGYATEEDDREKCKTWIVETIGRVWSCFRSNFLLFCEEHKSRLPPLPFSPSSFLSRVWKDTLGFAGCAIIRRVVGIAHADDLEAIASQEKRADCERQALLFGQKLMLSDITSPEELLAELPHGG